MNNIKKTPLSILLGLLILSSCQIQRPFPTRTPYASQPFQVTPASSASPTPLFTETTSPRITTTDIPFVQAHLITIQTIDEFGWLANGQIYYSELSGDSTYWHSFDTGSMTDQSITSIRPFANADVRMLVTSNDGGGIITEVVAPSGNKIIYHRFPEDYERPSFETPIPDYFPPSELWLADSVTGRTVLLSPEFASNCGELDRLGQWRENETLFLGSCSPFMGPATVYFVVNTEEEKINFLTYSFDGMGYFPNELSLAHDTQSIVFVDGNYTMWIVPANDIAQTLETPLDSGYHIPLDGATRSPQWSSDDIWIYFWSSDFYVLGRDDYPLTLKRINAQTLSVETVISEDSMSMAIGQESYRWFYFLYGAEVNWQLGPNGKSALIFLIGTRSRLPELWFISWP